MKWSGKNSVVQTVKVVAVDYNDELEGIVTVLNNLQHRVTAFFWGEKFDEGEELDVEFHALDYPLKWEVIFAENRERKLALDSDVATASYCCYGKIIGIDPVIADFGDIVLDIGRWTNDPKTVGEYIYWKIDRLDISRH